MSSSIFVQNEDIYIYGVYTYTQTHIHIYTYTYTTGSKSVGCYQLLIFGMSVINEM